MKIRSCALLFLLAIPAAAQLTQDQRLSDFRNLVDLYARRYAGIEWKKSLFQYDLLDLSPWTARVADAKSDLEFYDLMVEYVSKLQDAHDQYVLPSDFEAWLDIGVDIYDGKVLIDAIDRKALPSRSFPPQIGDELVSVDGKPVAELLRLFSKYVSGGNPRTVQRLAAELITDRYQGYYPWAHQVPDEASVEIRARDGSTAVYRLPWNKSGEPLTVLGPSAGPYTKTAPQAAPTTNVLRKLTNYTRPGRINVVGYGRLAPVFDLPAGFVQGLGGKTYDSYFTGSYKAEDGTRIGYLRIPDFMYPSMKDLDGQIPFFELNTDVLVVDVMRNPGGDVCAAENILSRLTNKDFFGAWAETRVTWADVLDLNWSVSDPYDLYSAEEIEQLKVLQAEYQDAYQNKQGRTKPMSICALGATRPPAATHYTKPVLFLTDELSASAADIFASLVQDNHIGPIFGFRTMGAGGSPEQDPVGVYSEGGTSLTRSLAVRTWPVATNDYPATSYIENVGVRPDILADYMTADNLVNHGDAFVKAFTAEAVKLAKPKQ